MTFGLGAMVQLDPFQCSVRVVRALTWSGRAKPTAHASLVDVAATDVRTLSPVPPFVFWVPTIDQPFPFQCSLSVCETPFARLERPTVQMSLAETAATAFMSLWPLPFGLGTTFQVPWQLASAEADEAGEAGPAARPGVRPRGALSRCSVKGVPRSTFITRLFPAAPTGMIPGPATVLIPSASIANPNRIDLMAVNRTTRPRRRSRRRSPVR